jgi:hypothetical protein
MIYIKSILFMCSAEPCSTSEYCSEESFSNDCCSICLEKFHNDIPKIMLSCNHTFHNDCLYSLMLNNYQKKITFNTCPLCRKYISTNIQKNYIFNNIRRLSLDSVCVIGFVLALMMQKLLNRII